jgi:hypothetical protein
MVEIKCRSCSRVFISEDEGAATRARDEHCEECHKPELIDWSKRTEEWRNLSDYDREFLQQAKIGV